MLIHRDIISNAIEDPFHVGSEHIPLAVASLREGKTKKRGKQWKRNEEGMNAQ